MNGRLVESSAWRIQSRALSLCTTAAADQTVPAAEFGALHFTVANEVSIDDGHHETIVGALVRSIQPTPFLMAALRQLADFDMSMDFNCQAHSGPSPDISKYGGSAANNCDRYDDPTRNYIHAKMLRSAGSVDQRRLYAQRAQGTPTTNDF